MEESRKTHTKKSLKILWILFMMISLVYWLPKADGLLRADYSETSRHIVLNDHWNIALNETYFEDVSLDDFYFQAVDKGDRIVMECVLPEQWGLEEGALRINIKHSVLKIYVDGELVYSYGQDRAMENKTVGSGIQFINFPTEYQGKKLRIEWLVTENEAFTRLDPIRIYDWENAYKALLTENRLPMFLGSFFTMFGLVVLVITMFAVLISKKFIRMIYVALFSICMGVWTLCYYNVMAVFSIPLYSISLMEYIALYLAPVPLIIYMYDNVKNLKHSVFKAVYWILLVMQVGFDVVIISLHTMDIVHCAAALKYMQMILVCHIIFFTGVLILNLKSSHLTARLYLCGVLVVAVSVGYDLLSYYLDRFRSGAFMSLKGVSCIGVMIFIFIIILVFYLDLTERMMKETERNYLIKSAYTDELTMINNRRYCSEYMMKLNNENPSGYAVVCFDLNNLKVTNDTFGHAKGDRLIRSAADVITETFEKSGIVGRMGGDEFIAILTIFDRKEIEELIRKFKGNIDKKNQEEPGLDLSISYGFALSSEMEEKNIQKVYQMADDRMYENKKRYKGKG